MSSLSIEWTTDKVIAFAPDQASVKASQKLASAQKWRTKSHNTALIWGEFQGSGKNPYQVKIDIARLQQEGSGYHCSCPSRKQPCKHVLALLFILADSPEAVTAAEAPAFVTEWLAKAAQQAEKRAAKKKRDRGRQADPKQQAKTAAARLARIQAGFDELEPWLLRLIRHGLANPQLKSIPFWTAKAARMVDAQAPGIASWLKALAALPKRGDGWNEALLKELGQLYLLLQSFKRFDHLSPEIQADLRAAVGWYHRQEEVQDATPVRDLWLVTGRYETDVENRLRLQRLWLRGRDSQRDALILDFAHGNSPFETHLLPGEGIEADLVYFPSCFPLRAFIKNQSKVTDQLPKLNGASIQANVNAYAQALAATPWLRQFPFLLEAVIPVRDGGRWLVREADGTSLPVAPQFDQAWALFALSGHNPLQLTGEWDGSTLLPTTAVVEQRVIDFSHMGAN